MRSILFCLVLPFAALLPASGQTNLAADLYFQGDWSGFVRASAHGSSTNGAITEQDSLVQATTLLRQNPSDKDASESLSKLSLTSANADTRSIARQELARASWASGKKEQAFDLLAPSLNDPPLGDHVSVVVAMLHHMLSSDKALSIKHRSMVEGSPLYRLHENATLGKSAIFPEPKRRGFFAFAGKMIISLYRGQVRPALSSKCPLIPSCSQYFEQASEKHGIIAFPMIAERFISEPSTMSAGRRPVPDGDRLRFYDPVSDHDFWFAK